MNHEREHGRRGSGARRHGDVFVVFGSRDGFRQRERGRRREQGGDDENFSHRMYRILTRQNHVSHDRAQ